MKTKISLLENMSTITFNIPGRMPLKLKNATFGLAVSMLVIQNIFELWMLDTSHYPHDPSDEGA